ncbi:hypothetical protein BC833DRAFT_590028 [Globomyces pollinis-pini]|nr:hypothetical protein BC833DRAFT_590028 [Globomyces pollinis-pini]
MTMDVSPTLLVSERWVLFSEAISMIFSKWTALQIAIDNCPYSHQTNLQSDLLQLTVSFYKEFNGKIEPDELEKNFTAFIEDQLCCTVEDGSPLQVANDIVQLYKLIVVQCDLELFNRMKAEIQAKGNQAKTLSKTIQDEGASDDSDWNESVMGDGDSVMGSEDMAVDPPKPTGPIIDDDGFELVQRKGRRK